MIGLDELAEAARYSDALSEESADLRDYVERHLDTSFDALWTLCEQRALRAVVIATGDFDKLAPLREGKQVALQLTREQHALLPLAQIAVMDGISIGMTNARMPKPGTRLDVEARDE